MIPMQHIPSICTRLHHRPVMPMRRLRLCSEFTQRSALIHRRLQSTGVLKGEDLGPVQEHDHQSFRVRKDGKPLPLPPLLDPIVLSERSRWEKPKASRNVDNLTPFQQKLYQNPYAHALASPVRQCRSTLALLPSDLLFPLYISTHPQTSEPWLLPVHLTTKAPQFGAPFRFLCWKPVVQDLGEKEKWRSSLNTRMEALLGRAKLDKLVWREDMPELILSLLRVKALNELRWHFKFGRMVACDSPRPEDIDNIEDVACVIYFGSLETPADEIQARQEKIRREVERMASGITATLLRRLDPHKSEDVTHVPPRWWKGPVILHLQPRVRFPPLEFPTTTWKGSRVPVFSLHGLLGEDKARELVEDSRFKDERCLVMRRWKNNVEVQLSLLQLQSFLAKPGP